MRVVNPEETVTSSMQPLRFTNNTQDADVNGWLTLGTAAVNLGTIVNVTRVTVTPTSASVYVGSTVTLKETVLPTNASYQNVTFSSNNNSVVTVVAGGLVCGVSEGTATITATTVDGGYTTSCNFTVTNSGTGINCGGTAYTSASLDYSADTDFDAGSSRSTSNSISNTSDQTLYQTWRLGSTFNYNIAISNGDYLVTLMFAETYWTAAGKRVFDVSIEGNLEIDNLDIYAMAGKNVAYDVTKSVSVSVSDGQLNISLNASVDQARLHAIKIQQVDESSETEDQTINFLPLANKTYGDGDFAITADASSGLPVSFSSSNTNVATINGDMIQIVGEGDVTITASQQGNNNYNAAPSVERTFTVTSTPSPTSGDVTAITSWVSGTNNPKVAGSNRMMVVMVMGESTAAFVANTATYGGQAMTRITDRESINGSTTYGAIFILNETGVNAATSGTIVIGWSATPSAGSSIYSISLGNVDQTSAIVKANNSSTAATSISTSALAAASGDMVVMCGATANNKTQTFNNSFIKQFESNSSWGDGVGGSKMGTGVNETPKFTQSATGRMVICAMVAKKSELKSAVIVSGAEINKSAGNMVKVYPNPVSKTLYINHAHDQRVTAIKIFNTQGQMLFNRQATGSITEVDVNELNCKGFILVQVASGQDVSTFKVSVAK